MFSLYKKMFIGLGIIIVALILFLAILWWPVFNQKKPVEFGVSFSESYAEFLGLNWQEVYLAILDDLKTPFLRLDSEWDKIEPARGVYNFENLDWEIQEAEKRGVEVLLVIGERQPRWPECHLPSWLADSPRTEVEDEILEMEKTVVQRYKNSKAIKMWQVENEPLFNLFGTCPRGDKNFLQTEIALVKSLDDRPILITDSGELSTWRKTAHLGDYFGTTLYRVVYNPYFGYFHHFWPPSFYRLKAKLVGLPQDKVIISELQVEPWVKSGSIPDTPIDEQKKIMSSERIEKNLDFARQTGFGKAYLWGVEWWYWLKERGDDSAWQIGKEIWQK
jgi:hypothetical protein